MTRLAAFGANGSVFKREWPTFVAMTAEAPRLIRGYVANWIRQQPAMRIVAIDAINATLVQAMLVRALKLGQLRYVTGAAVGDILLWLRFVNRMATGARNLITGMAATNGAYARRLIQMALQTDAIRFGCG